MSYINQNVQVDAFYFLSSWGKIKTFPKQIDLNNQKFIFNDGLQYLVKTGQKFIKIFEMSDGNKTYRIKFEDNQWTLIGTK